MKRDVPVKKGLVIPAEEIHLHFSRSSGPGGQNVNKLNTRVELRFDLTATQTLTADQKSRVQKKLASRVNGRGELILFSERTRSQEKNIDDVLQKLGELLADALKKPKKRIPTRPSRSAREERLKEKKKRSDKKRLRGRVRRDE